MKDRCVQALRGEPIWRCVEEFLGGVEESGKRLEDTSKSAVYAYFAAGPRPRLRLGEAAQAGVLPLDHRAFDALRTFLRDQET